MAAEEGSTPVNPTDKFNVNLSIWVRGQQDRRAAMDYLQSFVGGLNVEFDSVHLSTHGDYEIEDPDNYEVPEELHHDEDTLNKVAAALEKGILESPAIEVVEPERALTQLVTDLISEMNNAGIFFRERKP